MMDERILEVATDTERKYLEAVEKHGSNQAAAKALGVDRRTVDKAVARAEKRAGQTVTVANLAEHARLKEENRQLRARLKGAEEFALRNDKLARFLALLDNASTEPPKWTFQPAKKKAQHGTPTLFLSDLHWGERVNGPEVNGVNEFDLDIAHRRLRRVVESALHLLFDVYAKPDYPGIVVPLGGDLLSGNIHEELRDTNELQLLPAVLDITDHLEAAIRLLGEHFKRIFVPVVVGNHGRLDRQKRFKGGVRDNVDWLVGRLLAERFKSTAGVDVLVSESFDCYYRIHRHRYLLTHGDSMRGGSGIAGPVTPWALGDHRRRKRQQAIDQPYDTMIFGHWHTLAWGIGGAYICNGSIKGYDEFAFKHSFPFEPPQQALWQTHPRYGITSLWGVRADRPDDHEDPGWVSVQAA